MSWIRHVGAHIRRLHSTVKKVYDGITSKLGLHRLVGSSLHKSHLQSHKDHAWTAASAWPAIKAHVKISAHFYRIVFVGRQLRHGFGFLPERNYGSLLSQFRLSSVCRL